MSPVELMFDSYRIEKTLLQLTGTWPNTKNSYWYLLRSIVLWGTFLLDAILLWISVYSASSYLNVTQVLDNCISITCNIFKLISIKSHGNDVELLEKCIENPLFSSHSEESNKHLKEMNTWMVKVANSFRTIVVIEVSLLAIHPFIDGTKFPTPIFYHLGVFYIPVYLLQVACLIFAGMTQGGMDTMTNTWMAIGTAQLKILGDKLRNIKPGRNVHRQLEECVRHHLLIIEHVEHVENVFTLGLFFQFLSSVISICNSLFHALLAIGNPGELIQIMFFSLLMLLQPFMYCWFGDELLKESINVCDASYFSKWEECDDTTRQYLFMIMERAKKPLSISAMKFTDLSLQTFLKVIKWAYAYFALLNSFYQRI